MKKQPTSKPEALGYASRAVLTALIRQLVETGALSKEAAMLIKHDAVSSLLAHNALSFVPHAVADCNEIFREFDEGGLQKTEDK